LSHEFRELTRILREFPLREIRAKRFVAKNSTGQNCRHGRGRGNRRNLLGGVLAGLLERVWTTATYFILPIMVIEDLSLFPAVKRATEIVKKNLLLVAVTEIGVSGGVGLVGFIRIVIAVGIGVGIFAAFSALGSTAAIIGAGAAVLLAGTLIALVSAFSSYVTTAYHT